MLISKWIPGTLATRDGDSLLLSRADFHREVVRERIRATRRAVPFCLLTITLQPGRSLQSRRRRLARVMHRHLRLTDHKAVLGRRSFGVLLVDTPEMGGRAVLDRLDSLCESLDLNATIALRVHDPDGFDPDQDRDDSSATKAGNGDPTADRRDGRWLRIDERRETTADDSEQPFHLAVAGTAGESDAQAGLRQQSPGHHTSRERTNASIAIAAGHGTATHTPGGRVLPVGEIMVTGEPSFLEDRLWSRRARRGFDLVGAAVGLVVTSPLLVGSMVAIKLTSPGPVVFRQIREGRGGRPFTIYKLRTMVADAEQHQARLREHNRRDGPAFKIDRDPRVTAVGRWLRSTCIDELPQLINVIKGDMSLVGPRPLPWHESRACRGWHRRRLDVRPGLTCTWQVDKSAAETFDDWMRMDLRYVDRRGFWEDTRLLLRTVTVPIRGRGNQ